MEEPEIQSDIFVRLKFGDDATKVQFQEWLSSHEEQISRWRSLSRVALYEELAVYAFLGWANLRDRDEVYEKLTEIAKNLPRLMQEQIDAETKAAKRRADEQAEVVKQTVINFLLEKTQQLFRPIDAMRKRDASLAIGRRLGVKARTEKAKASRDALIVAIGDLFDTPEKPGWGWRNDDIVAFLLPYFDYKKATLLSIVKREAGKHRKARKAQQASRLPKR